MRPGHPCLFFLFPFSPSFSFPFCRSSISPTLPLCLFVLSFFVCFLYRLLRFFCFASLLSLVADYVLLSRCYIPPAMLVSQSAYSPYVLPAFFSCVVAFYLFNIYSLPSLFFDFDLDVVCFILSCSCGYQVLSVLSPRFRFLLCLCSSH